MIRTFQIKCDDKLHVQEACLVHGSCKAYKIRREFASDSLKILDELDACGVYLLLSGEKVYVGEAESVSKRVRQHLQKPPYDWQEAVAFVGVGGAASDWEKSSIKYMEHKLYSALVVSKSYVVVNGNTPKKSKVSMPWIWDDQVREIESLLPFLGYSNLFIDNQLANVFPNKKCVKEDFGEEGFPYKIGKVVRMVFPYVFDEGLVTEKDVLYLLSADAVKRFQMRGHPILFHSTGNKNDGVDARGVRLYYPGIRLKRGRKSYLLSNQFYREALAPLLEWLKGLGVTRSKVLSLCDRKYGRPQG